MNIILLYDYIIDREVISTPPSMIPSLIGRIVYHFPPFTRALRNVYCKAVHILKGSFPLYFGKMDIAVHLLNEYNKESFDEYYSFKLIIIQVTCQNTRKFYAVNESLRRI